MARPKKYPDELIDRGIRLVFESGRPISYVARDLGLPAETVRKTASRPSSSPTARGAAALSSSWPSSSTSPGVRRSQASSHPHASRGAGSRLETFEEAQSDGGD